MLVQVDIEGANGTGHAVMRDDGIYVTDVRMVAHATIKAGKWFAIYRGPRFQAQGIVTLTETVRQGDVIRVIGEVPVEVHQ